MPRYSLLCEDCSLCIEIECSISEYDTKMKSVICPECASKNVHRNYQDDNIYSSVKEINTIGQLADHNTKKIKSKLSEQDAMNKELLKNDKPWYHSYASSSNKEINKMNKKEKRNYILKGSK
jgi:hypothetical protein